MTTDSRNGLWRSLVLTLLLLVVIGGSQAAPTEGVEAWSATAITQGTVLSGTDAVPVMETWRAGSIFGYNPMLDQRLPMAPMANVPDGGVSLILLGVVLLIIETLRRKLFS